MSFSLNGQLDKTNMLLDLITVKQQALSSNIANVSTPGYARQDITFEQYIGKLNAPLETKMSKNIGPSPIAEEREGKVNIAEELMAMQKNSLFYSVATRRANSLIQELKTVAQVGR
jgi:flagellar basal body rod protein FlgB